MLLGPAFRVTHLIGASSARSLYLGDISIAARATVLAYSAPCIACLRVPPCRSFSKHQHIQEQAEGERNNRGERWRTALAVHLTMCGTFGTLFYCARWSGNNTTDGTITHILHRVIDELLIGGVGVW
jgi:hypothetical protein